MIIKNKKKSFTFKFDNVACRTGRLEENFGIDRMQHVDPSVAGEQLNAFNYNRISALGQTTSDGPFRNAEVLTDTFSDFKPQNTKIE